MRLVYINKGASPSAFDNYLKKYDSKLQQQGQKYNQLLMEGFVANGAEVLSVSTRPINRKIEKRLFFKRETEKECGITYDYVPFVNYPVFRNITVLVNVFFKVLFVKGKRKENVVICDALNIAASFAAWLAAKVKGIPTVGIVTDVPCYRPNSSQSRSEKINLALMKKFDSYLLLTDNMREIVNPKNRPYIVLEGHTDMAMAERKNILAEKANKKICFYAGSLRKIYGIKNLVEGFIAAGIPDTELHIYGDGDYANELGELVKKYDNVIYHGVAPNTEIVEAELKATLLINPRPTNEEYTKYSFPSKNMEYMASGTPVLTTRLPGMPEDHKPHVFFIEKEDADGIKEALLAVFEKTPEELHEFGAQAKDFVLKEKNNKAQAKKVLEFVNESFGI